MKLGIRFRLQRLSRAILSSMSARLRPEQLFASLKEEGIVPVRSADSMWWDSLAEPEQALVNGALGAYVDYFTGGDLTSITWERDLFFIGDQPKVRATRPIDVTGRARCLIYGPYIMLPPGSWSASILLGFSKEAAELGYVVEVVAGTHSQPRQLAARK